MEGLKLSWAEPRGRGQISGGGQNLARMARRKPFWRPSENCFRRGHPREMLGVCKGLYKRSGIGGGGGTYRGEGGGGRKLFSVGVLLVRFCPPPPPRCFAPPFGVLWLSACGPMFRGILFHSEMLRSPQDQNRLSIELLLTPPPPGKVSILRIFF